MSVVLERVLEPPYGTTDSVIVSHVVPEAIHEASRRPLERAVSAQKALQGSEMETRELLGGPEEKSISLTRGH